MENESDLFVAIARYTQILQSVRLTTGDTHIWRVAETEPVRRQHEGLPGCFGPLSLCTSNSTKPSEISVVTFI